MKKLFFAMGVIAMSLTTLACNSQSEESQNMKSIKNEINKVEKFVKESSQEEVVEAMNKRSYALGANMGMSVNLQFGDMEFDANEIKDAIIEFYLNGDREDEKFMENNMKFQQFIYTRYFPYMQAKQSRDAFEKGGMTEEMPELPELYNEEFTKADITNILGSQMGASLIDVDGLNMGWLFKGFNDAMQINRDELAEMDPEAGQQKMDSYLLVSTADLQQELMTLQREMMEKQRAEQQKKAEEAKTASAEWLKKIEKKEGVKKTESGLLYRIDREGNDVFATADTDTVEVNYEGKTREGKVFDSSYERGESISFALNRVIRGWTEGMKLVGEGGQITLWIPSDMAYGERGAGQDIGPNEALEFKVELIKVTPAEVVE
jgi:FKBP-type peptidyl-prolyl cis-trans isomerase FkpA